MSSHKRPLGWLLPDTRGSNKRTKSPTIQTALSIVPDSDETPEPCASSSTNVPQLGPTVHGKSSTPGHAMLSTLKGSMKFLRKGCRLFPPLQSAVETLLDAVECIEDSMNNQTTNEIELREMASDLPQWVVLLSSYLSSSQPERVSELVKRLSEDLLDQAKYIRDQQQRDTRALVDPEGLSRCYRRIETSFRQLQTDASLSTWKITDDHLKDSRLNALSPAHDARYDSSFSNKIERGACFENTRVVVLEGIRGWIRGAGDAKIYWTNGMAGTGKTTIAYSVCAELEQHGRLGASYFCSRASSECQDVSRILPTIAYQLAQQFYPFRSSLCQILGQEANIGQRNISVQFEHLIRIPLLEVNDVLPSGLVVVIDALDECSDPRTVETMLDVLYRRAHSLPIRFFLTSRPEPSVANTILGWDNQTRSILHLHNVEENFVKADIETYLTIKLAKLLLSGDQIKQLAEQAGILFIYAATVARYLLASGRGANISTRLATVLAGSANRGNKKDREIDRLYMTILGAVLGDDQLEEEEVDLIKQVLWTVVCAREPVAKGTLAGLLKVDGKQVSEALQPLQSVLHVSEGSEVVSTLHASFPDFMLSSDRSGSSLYCNESIHSGYLARRCFSLMEEQLKFNICGLETSYQFDEDVPNIKDRVKAAISSELFYACRYWVEHLHRSSICSELLTCLDKFLHEQLLFWMEVLNLKGWMGRGPKILVEAQKWLLEADGVADSRTFVHDACNFVTTFAANPVRQSTPHIYVSVLPLTSRQSKVWQSYWGRTRGLLRVDGTLMSQRIGTTLAIWEVGCLVAAIAYSPDGSCVALASLNGTIQVWDAHTGSLLGNPFEGHTHTVTSIAFSPDATRIVSGSSDCTIRVWDLCGNTPLVSPLKGHTSTVTSVAFSPDGTRIASGSWDRTIRVWDVRNGTTLGSPFKGHTNTVNSVTFSLDGAHIISGSSDRTIRVWDSRAGTPIGSPFEGHTNSVTSIALSPDGTRIISGSLDCTIRVWDRRCGTPLGSPFKGHTSGVTSVAFSPDGIHIVSGSSDRTIVVWNACDGTPVDCPFVGHANGVTSIAISPDGFQIISGSSDCTIRVWDMHDGTPSGSPFEGHIKAINTVSFSPDDTYIVSGSSDCTIRMWDVRTGAPIGSSLEGHTKSIMSVAISPDGTRIVSASRDAIRVWDVRSGTTIGSLSGDNYTNTINSVAFSPDSSTIVSGSLNGTIQVWDVRRGTPCGIPFKCLADSVTSVRTSADDTRIVSGLWGHAIQVEPLDARSATSSITCTINSVAISPDGTRIVSGSGDCAIRVWDMRSGTPIGNPLQGHATGVTSVAISPEGTHIVSGSEDGTIWLWDIHTGTPLRGPFEGHTNKVKSVVFSPDGTHIISSSADRTIRVWDARAGTPVGNPIEGHTLWDMSIVNPPNGTCIISCSSDDTIQVWDMDHGALVPRVPAPAQVYTPQTRSITISPDGTLIASVSSEDASLQGGIYRRESDTSIQVWDMRSGALIGSSSYREAHVHPSTMTFSPDGTRIASGSYSRIRLWLARDITLLGTSNSDVYIGQINSIVFSPAGTHIVSGSTDGTIQVWDVRGGAPISDGSKYHINGLISATIEPNSPRIISSILDHTIRVQNMHKSNGPFEFVRAAFSNATNSIAVSPDGTRIISGHLDHTIKVWDMQSGNPHVLPLVGHAQPVTSIAISPDGTRIVSGSLDCTIRIWDTCTGTPLGSPLVGHTKAVTSVAFSPDSTRIISGSADHTVRLWDVLSGTPLGHPFGGHTSTITSVAFSPNGTHIVSGSEDCAIRVWDILRGSELPLQASAFGNWTFNGQGWAVDSTSQALLFWFPAELRKIFPRPPNSLTIFPNGTLRPDLTDLLLGESWDQCYVSSSTQP